MTNASRSDEVRALRAKYGLAPDEIARRAAVSVHTARAWLTPATSKNHREPSRAALQLLKNSLGGVPPRADAP